MDQPHENPAQAAPEPLSAPPSANGNGPAHPADIERDIRLALRALEDVDMRLANVQATSLAILAAVMLVLALELKELRNR